MSKVKYLPSSVGERFNLSRFPNFHKSGSVSGMKKLYYGKDALLVRCGNYIYNVSSEPDIIDIDFAFSFVYWRGFAVKRVLSRVSRSLINRLLFHKNRFAKMGM